MRDQPTSNRDSGLTAIPRIGSGDLLDGTVKYKTIVADPPWPYEVRWKGAAQSGNMKSVKFDEYDTMTIDQICELPVREQAEDDSHLYLWTTQAFMRDTYRVLDAWGYKQGAILVWSKPARGSVVGSYVCSVEFCIFARRGSLATKRQQIGTCYNWPRTKHSAKPEAFQDMVETMSPGPYLELFARRTRLGWHTWGNQALCHVNLVPSNTTLTVKNEA
jgi:N6-adenosine-specific RNA methylase IME4